MADITMGYKIVVTKEVETTITKRGDYVKVGDETITMAEYDGMSRDDRKNYSPVVIAGTSFYTRSIFDYAPAREITNLAEVQVATIRIDHDSKMEAALTLIKELTKA